MHHTNIQITRLQITTSDIMTRASAALIVCFYFRVFLIYKSNLDINFFNFINTISMHNMHIPLERSTKYQVFSVRKVIWSIQTRNQSGARSREPPRAGALSRVPIGRMTVPHEPLACKPQLR